jgi:putative salt-induced outer membrane protein YdiY
MNAQRYAGLARYAFSFGPRTAWYEYNKLEADHDRFANIDWRLTPAVGVGYWFVDREALKSMAEVAFGWEFTAFGDDTASRDQPVLVPRVFFETTLHSRLRIAQEVQAWPSLEDIENYRARATSTLTSPLTKVLALRLQFTSEYESLPGPGTRKHDRRLISSLVYSF